MVDLVSKEILRISEDAEKISDHYSIVNEIPGWKPPKMSAVYLAAAITACSRIHMYPYINREVRSRHRY